jgi:uncharacterized protein YecE (DUF72 family)
LIDLKIGTGGWAYFNVPGDKLSLYSKTFNTVEVNSTFYEYPSFDLVKSWRRRTPQAFEFTVRCHQDLSHRYQFQPINPAYQVFSHMAKICSLLKTEILQIQTPASFELTPSRITTIDQFLSSVNMKRMRIAWEIRSQRDQPLNTAVSKMMQKHDIIHCIDISRGETPAIPNDLLYTRLFGHGVHNIYQYTDKELKEINQTIVQSGAKKAILNFHNIRNYKDAARLKIFRKTGSFPRVTRNVGMQSLLEVLAEDTQFPTTKLKLMKDQGWKLFDWKENQRQHVSVMIAKLPDQHYRTFHDLIQGIMQLSSL